MKLIQTQVIYFRPNRTLECYFTITNKETIFIYNYEGYHFRLFKDTKEVIEFYQKGIEPALCFDCEKYLDEYLEKYY